MIDSLTPMHSSSTLLHFPSPRFSNLNPTILHFPFPSSKKINLVPPGSGFGSTRNIVGPSPPKLKLLPLCCSRLDSFSLAGEEDDELVKLVSLLPEEMQQRVYEHPELSGLIEIVMDLGRKPLARFPSGDIFLSDKLVSMEDIQQATSQLGDFAIDNRAGLSRTLHRISAIRNRKGTIIGLTCRVGRSVPGSANLVRDLVKDGASLLLIGPPGVGKTTIIRDIARMLADDYKKRVMIVDTSNEIAGEGDIPHTGIGNARRMQVPHTNLQHEVLIEAVENHMPQAIVIDEIGTKLEAMAASTIAQRGIQLVATAHGNTIENLVMNPTLDMLVGGVQSVTLSDMEAKLRRVQKTVLERKGPSTFRCGIEIISKTELRVHRNLEATIDAILSGCCPNIDVRNINKKLDLEGEQKSFVKDLSGTPVHSLVTDTFEMDDDSSDNDEFVSEENCCEDEDAPCIFLYGVSEASVIEGIKQLMIVKKIRFTDNISKADALLALQSKLKNNSRLQAAARSHGIPVYVTKTSSLAQLSKVIQALVREYASSLDSFESEANVNEQEKADALEEARLAIEQIVIPKGVSVDLLPRASNIMLLQKDLILKYKLKCIRVGSEQDVRLRILPSLIIMDEDGHTDEKVGNISNFDDLYGPSTGTNAAAFIVDRLPLLPD